MRRRPTTWTLPCQRLTHTGKSLNRLRRGEMCSPFLIFSQGASTADRFLHELETPGSGAIT